MGCDSGTPGLQLHNVCVGEVMIAFVAMLVLVLSFMLTAAGDTPAEQPAQVFISVEQRGILLVDLNQARKDPFAVVWSWQAADAPQIPAEHRSLFNGYDECKPVLDGSALLVCSSWNGAVALVNRSDKNCTFYAKCSGAHSAELIGKNLLAAALSNRAGELQFYRLNDPATPMLDARPLWSMPFPWGHGVVYDLERDRLFALNNDELIVLQVADAAKPEAQVLSHHKLSKSGGHDLYRYDKSHLAVTDGQGAYLFNCDTHTFAPLPALANHPDLKSVSRHPVTGKVMFTQAEPRTAHTRKLQWTDGTELVLPYELLYKARWNIAEK